MIAITTGFAHTLTLVDGDLLLLDLYYRVLPLLERWERTSDCHVCCGLLPRKTSIYTTSAEKSSFGSLLARMRRHVTFTPDTVIENERTSKVHRMITYRLLSQSTSTFEQLAIRAFESSVYSKSRHKTWKF